MEAAKAAVRKITGRTGHQTDVDEVINPAVTSETVKPHRHEETTEAVDREVHQHHYHTTVQPIQHKEIIPEKHTHNIIPQVEREFKHDNEVETHKRVSAELGQFQDKSVTHQTTHSTQAAPQVVGEHVHHHVHETVQPVIHKETVQPEVVHTTVPIHETHHQSAQHHGMSALPMKTLDEFTKAGGLIGGSKSTTHEAYEGAPRPYNEKLRTTIDKVLPGHHDSARPDSGIAGVGNNNTSALGGHNTSSYGDRNTSGLGGHNTSSYGDRNTSGLGGHNTSSYGDHNTSGLGGHNTSSYGDHNTSALGGHNTSSYGDNNTSSLGGNRPTASDKMNPMTDADRDGKRGVMD